MVLMAWFWPIKIWFKLFFKASALFPFSILTLNKSIERLSYNSIRQKISNYILDEYNKQNSHLININMTKQKLAETLGIPRPSLSRELINMKDIGIIDYYKDTIKILDLDQLLKVLDE